MISRELHNKFLRKYTKVSIAIGPGSENRGLSKDDSDGMHEVDGEETGSLSDHSNDLHREVSSQKSELDKLYSKLKNPFASAENANHVSMKYDCLLIAQTMGYQPLVKINNLMNLAADSIKNDTDEFRQILADILTVFTQEIGVNIPGKNEDFKRWWVNKIEDDAFAEFRSETPGSIVAQVAFNQMIKFSSNVIQPLVKKYSKDLFPIDPRDKRKERLLGTVKREENSPNYATATTLPQITDFLTFVGGPLKEYNNAKYFIVLAKKMDSEDVTMLSTFSHIVNKFTHVSLQRGNRPSDVFNAKDKSLREEFVTEIRKTPEFIKIEEFAENCLPDLEEFKANTIANRADKAAKEKEANEANAAQVKLDKANGVESDPSILPPAPKGFDLSGEFNDKNFWLYVKVDPEFEHFLLSFFDRNLAQHKRKYVCHAAMKALDKANHDLFVKFSQGCRAVLSIGGASSLSESGKTQKGLAKLKIFKESDVYNKTKLVLTNILGTKEEQKALSLFTWDQLLGFQKNLNKDSKIEEIIPVIKQTENFINELYGKVTNLHGEELEKCNDSIDELEDSKEFLLKLIEKLEKSKTAV